MTSSIGGLTSSPFIPADPVAAQQVKVAGKDSDGDNDGSKVAEVEKVAAASGNAGEVEKLATSGNLGTLVNTSV
jgi:hypothetical protein